MKPGSSRQCRRTGCTRCRLVTAMFAVPCFLRRRGRSTTASEEEKRGRYFLHIVSCCSLFLCSFFTPSTLKKTLFPPIWFHPLDSHLYRQTLRTRTMAFFKRRVKPADANTATSVGPRHEKTRPRTAAGTRATYNDNMLNRRPRFGQWLKATWLDILTMIVMGAIGLGVGPRAALEICDIADAHADLHGSSSALQILPNLLP